jgi:trehalose 6-phosphate synthase/phosphatase
LPDRASSVVSNREPYEHYWDERPTSGGARPAGGLVAALDPLMQAVGGVWIAWGSGDRDATRSVRRPSACACRRRSEAYTLRRLWLNQQDVHQYYYGYSNQFLWPLCHLRPALTRTREVLAAVRRGEPPLRRRRVEEIAAKESGAVSGSRTTTWRWRPGVRAAAAAGPHARALLAHPVSAARDLPRRFNRRRSCCAGCSPTMSSDSTCRCSATTSCAARSRCCRRVTSTGSAIVELDGHTLLCARVPHLDRCRAVPGRRLRRADARIKRLRARYAPGAHPRARRGPIDYSKGLEEKLKALDLLFDRYPELRERFTFVQIAVPSRTGIDAYDWLNEKLERMVWSINDRYGTRPGSRCTC